MLFNVSNRILLSRLVTAPLRHLESRAICFSGVTGSNLKQRIEAIAGNRTERSLDIGRKLLLTAAAIAAAVVPILVGLTRVPRLDAQPQNPGPRPAFEVASVKRNVSGSDKAYLQATPGRLAITNIPLKRLIVLAYDLQDYQLSGDPPWADSEHYDVQTKADGNPSVREMEGPMLQVLLEDRFKLTLHREIRQLPVYELTVGKGGAKLQSSKEGSCTPYSVDSPPPATTPGASRPNFCGFGRIAADGLNQTLDGKAVSMETLAKTLSRSYVSRLGRNVVDGTGLTGTFDIYLKWAFDPLTVPQASSDTAPQDLTGQSLFTALQEQLGLKLESTKGPVEVLVIDHMEKPTTN